MENYPLIKVTLLPDVIVEELENEAVLLNTKTEHYFGLDSSGLRFWQLLETTKNSADMVASLLTEYKVDEPTLQRDVAKFIIELDNAGLVTIEKD